MQRPLGGQVRAALAVGRPERAFDVCTEAARSAGSLRERRHAALLLERVAPRVPASARTHARRAAVRGLLSSWPLPAARVGAVAFPTVRGECGGCEDDCFVVAVVDVTAEAEDDVAVQDPQASAAVRAALDAVRALEGRGLRFSLRLEGPAGWQGDSLALAVALAAVSAARGRPVSDGTVATGTVREDGQIAPVGHVPAKASLLRAARPRARMLVASTEGASDARRIPVAGLQDAVAAVWGAESAPGVDDRLDAVERHAREGRWVEAARGARVLLGEAALEDDERVFLLSLCLAAANHSGDAVQAAEVEADLEGLLGAGVGGEHAVRALGSMAVSSIDALDAATAEALALRAGSLLSFEGSHTVHCLGPLALVRRLQGRFEESVALRQRSLASARQSVRSEVPRCLGDLSAALLCAGRPSEAQDQAERALRELQALRRRPGYRDATRPFLRYHLARALQATGQDAPARELFAEVAEFPGLAPALFAQLALCVLDGDAGRARLEELWARQPGFVQGLPVVAALFDRARAQLGDDEAGARLCGAVGLPADAWEEAGRRLPY